MKQFITHSERATKKLAQKLAQTTKARIFALVGDLGAGKTTFVQGFAKGLGIKEKIASPTFVLIRQHKIPKTKKNLFHIDLYRLENSTDLKQLGLEEIFSDTDGIVIIEWAEKLSKLPKNAVKISIQKNAANTRTFIILF